MAYIVLHNFLRKNGDDLIFPATWRNDVPNNPAQRNIPTIPRRSPRTPVDIRNAYANYFNR
nr:unnamed protein product [Callosobruchus chinensis]